MMTPTNTRVFGIEKYGETLVVTPLARIIHAFVGMASGCFVSSVGGGIGLGAVVKVEGPLSPGSFVMAV